MRRKGQIPYQIYTWLTEGPRKVEPQEAIVLNHIIPKFEFKMLERGNTSTQLKSYKCLSFPEPRVFIDMRLIRNHFGSSHLRLKRISIVTDP